MLEINSRGRSEITRNESGMETRDRGTAALGLSWQVPNLSPPVRLAASFHSAADLALQLLERRPHPGVQERARSPGLQPRRQWHVLIPQRRHQRCGDPAPRGAHDPAHHDLETLIIIESKSRAAKRDRQLIHEGS